MAQGSFGSLARYLDIDFFDAHTMMNAKRLWVKRDVKDHRHGFPFFFLLLCFKHFALDSPWVLQYLVWWPVRLLAAVRRC